MNIDELIDELTALKESGAEVVSANRDTLYKMGWGTSVEIRAELLMPSTWRPKFK